MYVESVSVETFAVILGYKNGGSKFNLLTHFECALILIPCDSSHHTFSTLLHLVFSHMYFVRRR